MLEEVSFLSAIGISLPLQHSPPWYARSRIGITLKIAIRAFSDEQVVEKREGIGGRDRDRTGDPLLAKQVLSQLSYTPTVGVTFILKHIRARRNPFLRF